MHINIAMALNVLQIVLMSYLAIEKSPRAEDMWIFGLLIAVPCITLPLLFNFKYNTDKRPTSWLGLYLHRKRLEEQQKIERLSASK